MGQRHVPADPVQHADDDPELLFALANQGVQLVFAGLHLAARELPAAGHLGRLGALAGEQASVGQDGRPDDDQRCGPFGVHAG